MKALSSRNKFDRCRCLEALTLTSSLVDRFDNWLEFLDGTFDLLQVLHDGIHRRNFDLKLTCVIKVLEETILNIQVAGAKLQRHVALGRHDKEAILTHLLLRVVPPGSGFLIRNDGSFEHLLHLIEEHAIVVTGHDLLHESHWIIDGQLLELFQLFQALCKNMVFANRLERFRGKLQFHAVIRLPLKIQIDAISEKIP